MFGTENIFFVVQLIVEVHATRRNFSQGDIYYTMI
jgi:hypothetical protein